MILRLPWSFILVEPNAAAQARQTAGARDERTLFAVACTPLLGRAWHRAAPGDPARFPCPTPPAVTPHDIGGPACWVRRVRCA
jgi:hypothetical protein